MNSTKVLFAAVVGAAAGAVAGILLAPDSGEKTRKKLTKESKRLKKEVEKGLDDISGKGTEVLESIKKQANGILSTK